MIVKVQLSLNTSPRKVLIYNRTKSIYFEDKACKELKSTMGNRNKVFFEAEFKEGTLSLGEEVEINATDKECF